MLSLYTVQSQANARQRLLLLLSAWLLACALLPFADRRGIAR